MKQVTTYVWSFLVVAFAFARPVFAEENSGKCLSKLNIIQTELTQYRQSSQRWVTVWGITWTAATASQLIIAASIHDTETRKDLWVGSASAALGLIPTWLVPPLATREIALTGDCENELSQAESFMKQLSTNSEAYSGPVAHISNVAVNLATSLILGLGFGHWGAAAISLGAGIPLGEAMILTYPRLRDGSHKDASAVIVPSATGPVLAISFEF